MQTLESVTSAHHKLNCANIQKDVEEIAINLNQILTKDGASIQKFTN